VERINYVEGLCGGWRNQPDDVGCEVEAFTAGIKLLGVDEAILESVERPFTERRGRS
jgi:hypothetical protein